MLLRHKIFIWLFKALKVAPWERVGGEVETIHHQSIKLMAQLYILLKSGLAFWLVLIIFLAIRRQEKVPDPTPIILNMFKIVQKCLIKEESTISLSVNIHSIFCTIKAKINCKFVFLFNSLFHFCLDPYQKQIIPDPGKSYGFYRIRIPNSGIITFKTIRIWSFTFWFA